MANPFNRPITIDQSIGNSVTGDNNTVKQAKYIVEKGNVHVTEGDINVKEGGYHVNHNK